MLYYPNGTFICTQAVVCTSCAHPARGPPQQHPSKMAANSSSTGSKSSGSGGGKQSGPSAEQVPSPPPRSASVATVTAVVVQPYPVELKPLNVTPNAAELTLASSSPSPGYQSALSPQNAAPQSATGNT